MSGTANKQPFALELLAEYRGGRSIEELSLATGIPQERIRMRLAAAALLRQRNSEPGNGAGNTPEES